MSKAIDVITLRHIAGTKSKIDTVSSEVTGLVDLLRSEVDWDAMTDEDISKYNDSIDTLRYSSEALMAHIPVKVHRCRNCGNIFFSGSNSKCCNVWDPTGTRCCTDVDMPAPYKTWKCPPRRIDREEE